MMCFRDMTFCTEKDCLKFDTCSRAFTEQQKEASITWWGSDDAPVAIFIDKQPCFEDE